MGAQELQDVSGALTLSSCPATRPQKVLNGVEYFQVMCGGVKAGYELRMQSEQRCYRLIKFL